MNIRHIKLSLFCAFAAVSSCATQQTEISAHSPAATTTGTVRNIPVRTVPQAAPAAVVLPEVKREFRGAWIATVANINWPTRNNLSDEQQKAEAIRLLDLLHNLNFNAVIFQARPSADALYKSSYEPWSYFLTGQTGKAPGYDPLEFWISESHKRGMELHVWLNPYRAFHTTGGAVTSESMVKKMPSEIVKLRNGTYWFDPSNPKTQDHVSNVVKDIVRRYDIDGLHFDDYFYPYREYNGGKDFPDDKSWNVYLASGGTLSRADWRRGNVNKFIKRIYDEIKAEKNHVKFGISPFGIWKPGYPAGITGSSQYDELYADAKLWLNEGWIDYFSPQLYWKEEGPQRFSSLLKWWDSENLRKRHLWPGLNTVGIKGVTDKSAEIVSQIKTSRTILKESDGEIHYSVAGLLQNPQMVSALKNGPYRDKALVPRTPWLKTNLLEKPRLTYSNGGNTARVEWSASDLQKVKRWVLYARYGDQWETEILDVADRSKTLAVSKSGKKLQAVTVRAVDRLGNESAYEIKTVN
ncbi:glycoside hydrolase family 10 protein [Chryseobacterium sp.]|uniref:glycoside hydrolase family 10 protein n=1 Tax=Chryseobacterium sp. TaxID=1871047 RepID=UPI0012A94645|nr:family 10 glycosylhydrolase [Chryseobacterium sp.]QFG53536.1 family 10 glycosylhydrolase [Chryseobacterium sp.]